MTRAARKRTACFFEKKQQKTFVCLADRQQRDVPPAVSAQLTKVFWFFFSKKNILPSCARALPARTLPMRLAGG